MSETYEILRDMKAALKLGPDLSGQSAPAGAVEPSPNPGTAPDKDRDCDCPCDLCGIGTGEHCGKPPCDQLVEFEGYFRSPEFVQNALGLRASLKNLAGTPAAPEPHLYQSAKEQILESRRADLHFENNTGLRDYLVSLAGRLLEAACNRKVLPNDPHFAEEIGITRGMIRAHAFILDEVADLRQASMEEYNS